MIGDLNWLGIHRAANVAGCTLFDAAIEPNRAAREDV
jgi:hypothetical protein